MPDAAANSRLSRMIARLSLQRAYLEEAARLIADVEGPVFEIGLGKARTYDHLVRLLPEREVYAFDGTLHCPPAAVPHKDRLILGNFKRTLAEARSRFEGSVAIAHCDFGSEDTAHDAAQADWLAKLVVPLMRGGGALISDRELAVPADWRIISIAAPEEPFHYHGWRVPSG